MKKKILLSLLVLVIASTAVFAAGGQQNNYQDGNRTERGFMPLYELVDEGVYKNVETGELINEYELPEECRIVDGEGAHLNQRVQEKEERYLNSNRNGSRDLDSNDSFRNTSRRAPHNIRGGKVNPQKESEKPQRNIQNRR